MRSGGQAKALGRITAFFSFEKQYLDVKGKCEPAFLDGIYKLTDNMMHEDDLLIVSLIAGIMSLIEGGKIVNAKIYCSNHDEEAMLSNRINLKQL